MRRSHVWIGLLICCMFMAAVVALFYVEPPVGAREPLFILIGALAAAFGSVVAFFFGTSAGSADKNALLARVTQPPASGPPQG
jgi:hypothetical protein